MAFLGQEEQLREFQDRSKYVRAIVLIGVSVLIARLMYLQILSGDQMRRYSEENRIKSVRIPAPRGMIFDRNRVLLVDNQPSFDLELTPQYVKGKELRKKVIKRLSGLINMSEAAIRKKIKKARHQPAFLPVKIKTELSREEVAKIETWRIDMPGIAVKMEIKRTNVHGDVSSHLLGYIGKVSPEELPRLQREKDYVLGDMIGKQGIEKQLEDVLRGRDGKEVVEVDAYGRRIRQDSVQSRVLSGLPGSPVLPGNNLQLSIDQDLQQAAKIAFEDKVGALVAMDPNTGEILAMISRPSFDPTEFSRGISTETWNRLLNDENRPLRDKSVQDHYAPGSVFKVVTAITALMEGAITKSTKIHCPGHIRVGRRLYHCHRRAGHAWVNVVEAISKSCDVFFYRVSQRLKSVDLISKWAVHLGLGKKTNIELPREVPGLMPTEQWKMDRFNKPWTQGESLTVAIGQSFVLTTVLQLANLYSTIANGGTLYQPYFLKNIESHEGRIKEEFFPKIVRQVDIPQDILEIIKEGLYKVVNDPRGTAYWQRLPDVEYGGKTGTSQVIRLSSDKIYSKCKDMKYRFRHHGLFAAIAPIKDPKIAVAVLAEHSCSGSGGAAPVARAVIKKYMDKYFPKEFGPFPPKSFTPTVSQLERPQ